MIDIPEPGQPFEEPGRSPQDPTSQPASDRPLGPIDPNATIPTPVRLTADLEGTGGRLKDDPDDFVVDEIPLYEPSGKGEHLYLRVQKRDYSHEKLLQHLGRTLNISRHDIGAAGMKDRRAVTTQWVSVPARCADQIGQIENEFVHVLDASKHTNGLKTGHCKGNRFRIRVRDVGPNAHANASAIIDRMRGLGCPNYYGLQRFGIAGETLNTGYQLVVGAIKQATIPKYRRKFIVRLSLSALQSAVFNDVLANRLRNDLFSKVLEGDVMTFPGSRSVFEVQDPAVEQRRLNSGEILLTGPMVGTKMRGPTGTPLEHERDALAARGLRLGQFASWKNVAPGARRALSVRPEFHRCEQDGDALMVELTLPSGSFATVVLDEIMKA